MRRLVLSLLIFCSLPAWSDSLDDLYKVAGWSDQRAHFNDALTAAQERYRSNLPPAVYQALVNNSSQRFDPQAMDTRAKDQMRKHLADPAPALAFSSPSWGARLSRPSCWPRVATSWPSTPKVCRASKPAPPANC